MLCCAVFWTSSPAVWCKLTLSLTAWCYSTSAPPLTERQGNYLSGAWVSELWWPEGQLGDRTARSPEPWEGDLSDISGLVDKTDPAVPQRGLNLSNRFRAGLRPWEKHRHGKTYTHVHLQLWSHRSIHTHHLQEETTFLICIETYASMSESHVNMSRSHFTPKTKF